MADRADPSPPTVAYPDATEDNAFWPVTITTGAWLIAGLVLLITGAHLSPDRQWWPATCAVGVVSGIGGMIYIRRRAGRPRRAAARAARESKGPTAEPGGSG